VSHLAPVEKRPQQFLRVNEIAGMLVFSSDLKVGSMMHREEIAGK
jgi:hypothetical protein